MLKEKFITTEQFRIRILAAEKNLKEMTEKFTTTDNELKRVEKINALLTEEKNKMKERMTKLKARRGKGAEDFKICKRCGKDYSERENYNWSCKTHKSQWSGEMWWCCGKRTKEGPGC